MPARGALSATIKARLIRSFRDRRFLFTAGAFPILGFVALLLIHIYAPSITSTSNIYKYPTIIPTLTNTDAILDVIPVKPQTPLIQSFLANWKNVSGSASITSISSQLEAESLFEQHNCSSFLGGLYISDVNFGRVNSFTASLLYNETSRLSLPTMINQFVKTISPVGAKISPSFELLPPSEKMPDASFLTYGPILLEYSIIFLAPLFAISVIIERERSQKELLHLSGLMRFTYWIGTFVSDWTIAMVPSTIVVIGSISANFPGFRSCWGFTAWTLYGALSASNGALAYCVSFLFAKEDIANRWLYSAYSFTTLIPFLVVNILLKGQISQVADLLLSLFPGYGFSRSISKLSLVSINGSGECSEAFGAISINLAIMFAEFVVLFGLVLALEQCCHRPVGCCSRSKKSEAHEDTAVEHGGSASDSQEDEDVVSERHRAFRSNETVRIQSIRKTFTSGDEEKVALAGVSFTVSTGELLCLLGHNGAGKSTLISILTGQLTASSGTAYLDSHTMGSPGAPLGICMQQDTALYDNLTGREQLELVGGIRGVPDVPAEIASLIATFQFEPQIDKRVSSYSGGNKRKVSVMCALLGRPRVIFLDEPSNGLDAAARRNLWNAISQVRRESAVILTTHSMEEAEALADKVAILSHGTLNCVGSPTALKAKFGSGYQVSVKASEAYKEQLRQAVPQRFQQFATMNDDVSKIEIPKTVAELEDIFEFFESQRRDDTPLDAADYQYSIAATSLAQVFLAMGREMD